MKRTERYKQYRKTVAAVTKLARAEGVPGYTYGATLDHIVPVSFGFKHGIDPALIGANSNLQWMDLNANIQKGAGITAEAIQKLRGWGCTTLADTEEYKLDR